MKNIVNNRMHGVLFSCLAVVLLLLSACKDDTVGKPVITSVRNYAASPNDTLISRLVPGQFVVIEGDNLQEAVMITFDGVPATINKALFSNHSAVVTVPAVIPFPTIAEEDMNKIKYVTTGGETTYTFDIVAGSPVISGISNENPLEGEDVIIAGSNLFLIEEVSFSGVIISDYKASIDGTSISFKMPASSTSGPLSITTASGTVETKFNVNDLTTGVIINFDGIGKLSWGCGTSNSDPDFAGNHGNYAILNTGNIAAGDGTWWGWERCINTESAQWVPVEELSEPLENYALKFEMNISGNWNGVSLLILKDYGWNYLARLEPWQISETKTTNITTGGKWITVTVPFTEFRNKKNNVDGTGDPATDLKQIVGESGAGGINFFTVTRGNVAPIGFRAAFDNIRVVKIK